MAGKPVKNRPGTLDRKVLDEHGEAVGELQVVYEPGQVGDLRRVRLVARREDYVVVARP